MGLARTRTVFRSLHKVFCDSHNLQTCTRNLYSNCLYVNSVKSLNNVTSCKIPHRVLSTKLHSDDSPITKIQATDLVIKLTEAERSHLLKALQEYESNKVKAEYEGQLARTRWRSRYGRPSKLPTLGDVDPTGTYCQLSDDWLKTKYAEAVPPPTFNQLMTVAIHNAVPFIGFGFLDNFIMIIAGDYIEISLGTFITISTMAAAALGNTISDVMGIGSAWYVELLASKIGLKAPDLSPVQLDMKSARRFSNLGRAVGIIVGCLLGMIPLLFMNTTDTEKEKKKEAAA